MIKSYRKQFFEWVNKQPVYQNMTLQTKEISLDLVDCLLNNNQAYIHCARLYGKEFAKICAIDFCWFIKNQTISDLQHRIKVAEIATKLACQRVKKLEEEKDREMGFTELFGYDSEYDLQAFIDEYIDEAEKEMKGEKK